MTPIPRASAAFAALVLLGLATGCRGDAAAPAAAPAGPAATPANAGAASAAVDPETAAKIAFRDGVLAVVREELPGFALESSVDPEILRHDEAELGLQNLRAKCASAAGAGAAPGDVSACRGVIRQHFEAIRESLAAPAGPAPASFAEAAPIVRPQLAPEEYLASMKAAHLPFGEGLIVGFVLDRKSNYQFVTEEDLARWHLELPKLAERAFANLEAASRDIPVNATQGADRMLAIETGDGYDATRLLLPGFRRFAMRHLGERYYAAIPNRDALVLWAKDCSSEFTTRLVAHLGSQYRGEPYPLTDRIFEVGPDGIQPRAQ